MSSILRKIKSKKGFTLIEMLVTLAIVALLATLALPAFRANMASHQLISAANGFAETLHFARNQALGSKKNYYLNIQPGSSWCYGLSDTNTCDCNVGSCTINGTAKVTNSSSASSTVLSTSGFVSNNIVIDGIHGVFNTTGNVTFSKSGSSITIAVNAYGHVSFCSSTVAGYNSLCT